MMWNHRPIIIRIKRHENVHPFIQALHGQKIELKHVMFRDPRSNVRNKYGSTFENSPHAKTL